MIEMNENIYKQLPILLTITLYNYNYVDNRIIAAIKNNCFIIKKTDTKLVVQVSEVLQLLNKYFTKEINTVGDFPQDKSMNSITSAYQLKHLLNYYNSLKIVIINISMEKEYTRLNEQKDGMKYLALDYKIDKAIIRYDEHFNIKELKKFNKLLRQIKIIKTIIPYSSYSVYLADFLDLINNLHQSDKEKYKTIIDFNNSIYMEKIVMDNPLTILVTDFI